MALTTVDRVANEIKGTLANAPAATPQVVFGYIRTVTERVRRYGWEFEPLYAVNKITPNRQIVNDAWGLLKLPVGLLEVKSLTVGGVSLTYGSDVVADPDDGQTPVRVLRIADPGSAPVASWYYRGGTASPFSTVVITGFWGMRQFYADQGFFASGVTCPVMTATQTQIIVSDVAGADVYDRTPRFSVGNLIRVDDELSEIVDVDTSTKTLTLLRGVRGTTKAEHTAGTAIRIWEPEPDIVNAVTRQVALLYARRGAYMQTTTYPDGIQVSYPSDLLAELRATVQRFAYV